MSRQTKISRQNRGAFFQPETINAETRTVDVVFSTGADVQRMNFRGERYVERLSMAETSVDLRRLKAGASVLDSHERYSLRSVIGVVENARIENGKGIATLRLSNRSEVDPIWQDVQSGILRNVSVGYSVDELKRIDEEIDGVPVIEVTRWTPQEISFVSVPADEHAQVRIELNEFESEPFERKEMATENTTTENVQNEVEKINVENVKNEAIKAERSRCAAIRTACEKANLNQLCQGFIDSGATIDAVRADLLDALAKKETDTVNIVVGEDLGTKSRIEGATNALMARGGRSELTEIGAQYRNAGLLDIAKETLNTDTRSLSSLEIAQRAMHTTSDFPEIMANVTQKTLRAAYEELQPSYEPITRSVTVPDFKQVSRVQLGDAPELERVREGAEYRSGTVGEGAEKYSVEKFGKTLCVTYESIVNDDLDALTRLPQLLGIRARELESDLVWRCLLDNKAMSDGSALFHAKHRNLNEGGAGAIDVDRIGAMRSAMRNQKGLNGARISISPSYLIVPSELETTAEKFLAQIAPEQSANVNPFAGRLGLIVEPRLSDLDFHDSASAAHWYLAASSMSIDMIELARLRGEEGPTIQTRQGFDVDGLEIKIRHIVGVAAIDHRGFQYSAGA